jgi:hypothetical protein
VARDLVPVVRREVLEVGCGRDDHTVAVVLDYENWHPTTKTVVTGLRSAREDRACDKNRIHQKIHPSE